MAKAYPGAFDGYKLKVRPPSFSLRRGLALIPNR